MEALGWNLQEGESGKKILFFISSYIIQLSVRQTRTESTAAQ